MQDFGRICNLANGRRAARRRIRNALAPVRGRPHTTTRHTSLRLLEDTLSIGSEVRLIPKWPAETQRLGVVRIPQAVWQGGQYTPRWSSKSPSSARESQGRRAVTAPTRAPPRRLARMTPAAVARSRGTARAHGRSPLWAFRSRGSRALSRVAATAPTSRASTIEMGVSAKGCTHASV